MTNTICEITSWDRLQPKYCECCGCLWLRRSGSARAFCPACTAREAELATGGNRSFLQLWMRSRQEVSA